MIREWMDMVRFGLQVSLSTPLLKRKYHNEYICLLHIWKIQGIYFKTNYSFFRLLEQKIYVAVPISLTFILATM